MDMASKVSGNFLMMNHYGTGGTKPNNEFEVKGPKMDIMFFNKIPCISLFKNWSYN